MADPPREQVNPLRLTQLPMTLRPRRALCPPRFASRAPILTRASPRACRRPSWLARRAADRRSWRAERRRARPVRRPALCGSARGARRGRSDGGCRWFARTKSYTLCRVRAGRSFGSARRAAARRQWRRRERAARVCREVVDCEHGMGVGLWPACRPGVPLTRTARPLCAVITRSSDEM